jgi:peptide/nickel transport system substrate-binding protein
MVTVLVVVAACSGGGGADTLTAAVAQMPDQLDPHTADPAALPILSNIYETLVRPDDNLELQPGLAEDWEATAEGRAWTFTLREGVTFHDGSELTSADVVFSLQRMSANGLISGVSQVGADDDLTVVISFVKPEPTLVSKLAQPAAAIVPSEFDSSMAAEPVGTGPFKFESGTPGESVELVANDGYWGEAPLISGVTYTVIEDPADAVDALKGGDAQWTDNVEPLGGAQEEGLIVGSLPSTEYWALVPNQQRGPFQDRDLRRALSYGIDRDALVEAAMPKAAAPLQTAIPASSPFSTDYAPYAYEPDTARMLVDEAGAGEMAVDLLFADDVPQAGTAVDTIADQLADVGITINPSPVDSAALQETLESGEFDLAMVRVDGNLDPDDYYYETQHSGGARNFQGYSNPTVDRLLDDARQEPAPAARKRLYDQAARQIVDDASYIYLFNPFVLQAWVLRVKGYAPRSDGVSNFATVDLSD